jgi:hypothetical protein
VTSKEITDKILVIVKKNIFESDTISRLCKKIKRSVDSEFGGLWECNAFYNNIEDYSTFPNGSYNLRIKFGKLSINVWKVIIVDTNACYMESLKNVELFDDQNVDPPQVIVNTEWGAFGDNRAFGVCPHRLGQRGRHLFIK